MNSRPNIFSFLCKTRTGTKLAFPKPSEKNEPSELIGDEKSLPPTKVGSMLVKKSNTRSVSPTFTRNKSTQGVL
jgi:hypothetical protein